MINIEEICCLIITKMNICRLTSSPDLKRVLLSVFATYNYRQNDGNDGETQRERRSLYSESGIVYEVGRCDRSIKLQDRELGYNAAVRQTEDDVLRVIPRRVRAESKPDAVEVIHDQTVEHRDGHQVQDRHKRDTVVQKMQRHEYKRVSEDGHERTLMSPCKPLVQEVSAHELLRRRLHQNCEKYREQRQRFETVEYEINVAVNDRDEDTKRILSASD